jgi:hypothetical protein
MSYIQSNNYHWNLFQPANIYFVRGKDIQQFTAKLNMAYHF